MCVGCGGGALDVRGAVASLHDNPQHAAVEIRTEVACHVVAAAGISMSRHMSHVTRHTSPMTLTEHHNLAL